MTPLALLAALLGTPPGDGLTGLDHEVLAVLTESLEEGPIVFHYAPGTIAPDVLAEDVRANVAAVRELEELLSMDLDGPVHVFLYADEAEVERLTGVGTFAFSTGDRSVHQVRDFRGTHELVHVFATRFPAPDDAFTDGFVVEGLATGLTESESGAPLHAWCAVYGKLGRLPGLWDLRGTFPEGAGPGVHPYHVAGSFVRFLVERFGIERVLAWYVEALEAKALLGRSFVELEREWLAMLQGLEVDPAHEDVVRARLGLPRATPGGEWEEHALFDGATLAGWDAQDPGAWSVERGHLVGRCAGPWSGLWSGACDAAAGVRVRFRLVEGDGFRLELLPEGAQDPRSEAVFTFQATFLDAGGGHVQGGDAVVEHGFWNEAVLLRAGGREALYLNDVRLVDVPRAAEPRALRIGLGVENGRVEVASVTALRP